MLEVYQAYGDYGDMMDLNRKHGLHCCAMKVLGTSKILYDGHEDRSNSTVA
jgi:lysyl-tRNA synthetase class II